MQETALTMMLDVAVPILVHELKDKSWEYLQERMKLCGPVLAERGEYLFYQSKKPGETAEAFNRLAEGVAILSFAPGGVDLFGRHWENSYE